MAHTILIIDDDPGIRASLHEALSEQGFEVTIAADAVAAIPMLEQFDPEVVLSDIRMPDIDGLALLRIIRERSPSVDVILMTAYDDMSTVIAAMRGGALDFLVKPIGLKQLLVLLRRVFEDRRFRRQSARGDADADVTGNLATGLVGRDPRMIGVYKLIGQAAGAVATVLIRGESGTGKELVARAIHSHGRCAEEPFVPVNCAALPSTLLESELFGHVRGAFTGAQTDRKGRFALAGRGTIFLDEIGDTTLEFQTKLLRVIQDGEFQPVGAEHTEHTTARVIAATHQNLEDMVDSRRFREDLYYRLRVIEIDIPPLRERVSDIPLLAEHMIRRASASLGSPPPVIAADARDRLMAHSWPGNVRELENCLRRAAVIATGNVIRPEHLTFASQRRAPASGLSSLEDVERVQVARVLEATGGHKGRTAEILGVSRPRLSRLLHKYGIEDAPE